VSLGRCGHDGSGGRCGVAVELEEVVGGGDEPRFGSDGAAALRMKRFMPRLNFICAKTGSIIAWRWR